VFPISASCLQRRTVHIHKNLFDARGEPAVQVLRTPGLPVGGDEAVLKTNAGSESRSSKPRDFGVARMYSIPLPAKLAVQVLKTT
jgi:hypothetical protein